MKKIKIILAILAIALPGLLRAQTTESFTFTTNRLVPDGSFAGLSDVQNVNSTISNIVSLRVRLKLTGEYNGDLYAYLRHANGFTVLLNRVGVTAIDPFGYGDSGFDVTFQAGAANGDIHNYESVLIPADGSPLTGTWQPDGRIADPLSVTYVSSRSTSLTNFAGLNASGAWTLYLADVDSGGTNMLTQWGLDIVGAAAPSLNLSFSNQLNLTYGTVLSTNLFSASVIYNSTNVPGTFSSSPALGTVLTPGNQTISVVFTPNDTTTFAPVTNTIVVNIAKAPLTITAVAANKIYGANLPGFTATYSGFVNGDTAASLSTQVGFSTSATSSSAVGNYSIVPSGAASANYDITYVNGTLGVTPASITITADAKSKIYGASLPTLTASYSGFVLGEGVGDLTTAASLSTTATASSDVGNYPITASGAVSSNYTFSYSAGVLSVTPATLTVTANSQSKVYGASLPTLTASYSGFVLSQGTGALSSQPAITTTATASSGVGTYPITVSGGAAGNYNFAYNSGTLTITQAISATTIASSATTVSPGANVTFTATVGAVAPGAGTPSGLVKFRVDGSIAGSNTLVNGTAAFTTASLALGNHSIVAEYAGDANFIGSSNSLSQSLSINTPPVAGNVTIQRNPLMGVKVRMTTLLTNDSDADGDSLTLSVSSSSAHGGSVHMTGGWVFYTPAAGFTNADSFNYTVQDGRGGSATATVTVAIAADVAPAQNLVIVSVANGSVLLNGSGIPGLTYRIQYTASLGAPAWQDLPNASVTADSTGAFQYTDTAAADVRYYRSVYP